MSTRQVAVVTGATQALGTALARTLAGQGVSLALIDGDADGLARLERELASNRIALSTHLADPADPGVAGDVGPAVLAAHGRVDRLYLAADATTTVAFSDLPAAEFERIMAVVARTPVALSRALLPALAASGAGRVVVFPGRSGLDAVGAGAADAAAHYALRGFASGLGNELAAFRRGGVGIVYATAGQSPETVARAAVAGAARGRRRIIVGAAARALSWLDRALPVAQSRLIGARARRRAAPVALAGRTAVVTGAASGIGRGIARALAAHGCNLALVDRDAGPLETLADALRAGPGGLRITTHVVDVTDRAATRAMRDAVQAAHQRVDWLFNNAGVALGGDFARVSAAEFDWLLGINLDAVVDLTRLFLPLLRAGDDSAVVFTSSLFGLVAPPGQVAYSTSKFAVRGFATALRDELSGSSVAVTVAHPGGVKTAIARTARLAEALKDDPRAGRERAATEKFLRMDPDLAGRIIVEAARTRRQRVLVGLDAKVLSALERAAPVAYPKIMRAVFERASARKTS